MASRIRAAPVGSFCLFRPRGPAICLAGGGALLQGLADRLTDELKLRVWVAEDPLTCVARGAAMVFEDMDSLGRYLVGLERGSTRHVPIG